MNDPRSQRVTPQQVGTDLRWAKVTGPAAVKVIDRDWIRYVRIAILLAAVVLTWQIVRWQESNYDGAAAGAASTHDRFIGSDVTVEPTRRLIILPTVRAPAPIDSLPQAEPTPPPASSSETEDPPASTEGAAGGPREYVVQPGDTLGGIADSVSVPIEALMNINNISDPDQIRVGQVLKVPNPSLRSPGDVRPDTYTVAEGNTLQQIADRFGVDIEDLAAINGITNPDTIIVGIVLRIP